MHRVTKVLRMDLNLSETLLKDNPNLKVVHLFRDPRATIYSHFTATWFQRKNGSKERVEDIVKVVCKRMRADIEAGIKLMNKYQARVAIVQYEDFIVDTVAKMRTLYKFLGMKYTREVEQFVNNTRVNRLDINHDRSVPFSYRTKLSWVIVKMIDMYCNDVIHALGLKTYPTKELYLNITMYRPRVNSLPFALLSRHR